MGQTGIENPELKAAYFRDFAGEADLGHLEVLKRKVPQYQKIAVRHEAHIAVPDLSPYNKYPYAVRVSSKAKLTEPQQEQLREQILYDIHFISGNSF